MKSFILLTLSRICKSSTAKTTVDFSDAVCLSLPWDAKYSQSTERGDVTGSLFDGCCHSLCKWDTQSWGLGFEHMEVFPRHEADQLHVCQPAEGMCRITGVSGKGLRHQTWRERDSSLWSTTAIPTCSFQVITWFPVVSLSPSRGSCLDMKALALWKRSELIRPMVKSCEEWMTQRYISTELLRIRSSVSHPESHLFPAWVTELPLPVRSSWDSSIWYKTVVFPATETISSLTTFLSFVTVCDHTADSDRKLHSSL